MSLTYEDLRAAYRAALTVADHVPDHEMFGLGGCILMNQILGDQSLDVRIRLNSHVKHAFRTWPYFSGNPVYPVPDPSGTLTADLAYRELPLWYGNYGLHFKRLYEETLP